VLKEINSNSGSAKVAGQNGVVAPSPLTRKGAFERDVPEWSPLPSPHYAMMDCSGRGFSIGRKIFVDVCLIFGTVIRRFWLKNIKEALKLFSDMRQASPVIFAQVIFGWCRHA
jgi:hypothetical protein